jgi:hypothetical protein
VVTQAASALNADVQWFSAVFDDHRQLRRLRFLLPAERAFASYFQPEANYV